MDELPLKRARHEELSETQQWAIIARSMLFVDLQTLKLHHGAAAPICEEFGISYRQLVFCLQRYTSQVQQGILYPDMGSQKAGHVGRHLLLDDALEEHILSANRDGLGRDTFRQLAERLKDRGVDIPVSTLYSYIHELGGVTQKFCLKPSLSAEQKWRRLDYCLAQIDMRNPNEYKLYPRFNYLHIDEKWFHLKQQSKNVRILSGQEDLAIADHCQSKTNVPKVMFLVCVGRPLRTTTDQTSDGKVFCEPFVKKVAAKRDSVNRPAGVLETKNINVTAEIYRNYWLKPGGVLDAIKLKLPFLKGNPIIVQQDSATPHTGQSNVNIINLEGRKDGWNIQVIQQPPQSPDLNKLDLCFFWSLQKRSDHLKWHARTIDDLIAAVHSAYNDYDRHTLDRCHGVWASCVLEVLKQKGGNDYRVPHSGVRRRQAEYVRIDELPLDVEWINSLKREVDIHYGRV